MAREKWMKDPSEFDSFQDDVNGLNLNDSYAIQGSAGSGKTILALRRAQDITILAAAEGKKSRFTVVVYSTVLKSFIKTGINELGIDINQVVHYEQWDGSSVDYVIVDEAQDFTKDEIDLLHGAASKSIMLYGDSNQQIFSTLKVGVMSMSEIANHLDIPLKKLTYNYRLPKLIADFASHVVRGEDLIENCVRSGSDKPILKKLNNWQSELDFIVKEIQDRNFTDVGILLPFNTASRAKHRNGHRNMEDIRDYFDQIGFGYEYKMSQDENSETNLDFDSNLPKVMTFHSCKGLQFETVFIPFCDYPNHDQWFDDRFRRPFYVGLTRPYKYLYLTYSSERTKFFKDIASTKYQ